MATPQTRWESLEHRAWLHSRKARGLQRRGQAAAQRGDRSAWNALSAIEQTTMDSALLPWTIALDDLQHLESITGPINNTIAELDTFLHKQLDCFDARQVLIEAIDNLSLIRSGLPTTNSTRRPRTQDALQYLTHRRNILLARQNADQGYLQHVSTSLGHCFKAQTVPGVVPMFPRPAVGQPAELQAWLDQQFTLWSTRQQSVVQINNILAQLAVGSPLEQYLQIFVSTTTAAMNTFETALEDLIDSISNDTTQRETDTEDGDRDVTAMADVSELVTYIGSLDGLIDVYEQGRSTAALLITMLTTDGRPQAEIQLIQDAMTQNFVTPSAQLVAKRNNLDLILQEAQREGGIPSLDQQDEDDLTQEAADAATSDLTGPWLRSLTELGRGSHGIVNVWVKQGPGNQIVDRVAIKDSLNANPNHSDVNPGSGAWQPPNRMPTEVAAMYKLRDLPSSDGIVKIRNWRRKSRKMIRRTPARWRERYRIYMEFCEGRSLEALKQTLHPEREDDETLNEIYLWFLLDSLTRSFMLLERGAAWDNGGNPTWNMIIHGDIRPDNILMGTNTSGRYIDFLLPKISDFGVALIKPEGGIIANNAWTEFGGRGYRAPEQVPHSHFCTPADRIAGKLYTPGAPANVWAIGYTIYSLLIEDPEQLKTTDNPDQGLWDDYGDDDDRDPVPPTKQFDPTIDTKYSAALKNLIWDCLEVIPEDRPTLDEVRIRINAAIAADPLLNHFFYNSPQPSLPVIQGQPAPPVMNLQFANPISTNYRYALGLALNTSPDFTPGPPPGGWTTGSVPIGAAGGGSV